MIVDHNKHHEGMLSGTIKYYTITNMHDLFYLATCVNLTSLIAM